MSWIIVIWSAGSGASLMLALIYLLVWGRNRRSWANLCFSVVVFSVLGLAITEMITMFTDSPKVFGGVIRWTHLVYAIGVAGSLGFVHFYFGTGKKWLFTLALGLRLLAVLANFTTGQNLHIAAIHSLTKVIFLGEQVSILGEWVPNPWMRLGWLASLVQVIYVVDASLRLWSTGSPELKRRAGIVGGALAFFIVFAVTNAALVSLGVLRMPLLTSIPFLGMLLVMGHELSRDVLRAAHLARELSENVKKMDLAVHSAGLGLWVRDMDSGEVWATEKCRVVFGFTPKEPLTYEALLARVHPQDRGPKHDAVQRALAEITLYDTQYRVVLPDGSERWIRATGQAEYDADGKPTRMHGVCRDISGHRRAELETLELRQQLAHASRVTMLGQLTSTLAHELNQPLGAILRNAEAAELFLQMEPPDLEEVQAILADIRKDDQRASSVIARMRSLLKRRAIEFETMEIAGLIGEVTMLIRGDAEARHVTLETEVPDGLPSARGDRVQTQQVLINLILNAMDALHGLSNRERRVIVCVRYGGAGTVEIAVSDTGPGIPPSLASKLFDPFFTTKPQGMGIGLAISRMIIEAHGGCIRAENNAERGATFRVTLPVVFEEHAA